MPPQNKYVFVSGLTKQGSPHLNSNFIDNSWKNQYQCSSCSAVFQAKFQLKRHISDHHGNEMSFCCHICGKGYESVQGYKLHLLKHEGKAFHCPICQCKISQKSQIKVHLKSVHKAAQCRVCYQVFDIEIFDQHQRQCW